MKNKEPITIQLYYLKLLRRTYIIFIYYVHFITLSAKCKLISTTVTFSLISLGFLSELFLDKISSIYWQSITHSSWWLPGKTELIFIICAKDKASCLVHREINTLFFRVSSIGRKPYALYSICLLIAFTSGNFA